MIVVDYTNPDCKEDITDLQYFALRLFLLPSGVAQVYPLRNLEIFAEPLREKKISWQEACRIILHSKGILSSERRRCFRDDCFTLESILYKEIEKLHGSPYQEIPENLKRTPTKVTWGAAVNLVLAYCELVSSQYINVSDIKGYEAAYNNAAKEGWEVVSFLLSTYVDEEFNVHKNEQER